MFTRFSSLKSKMGSTKFGLNNVIKKGYMEKLGFKEIASKQNLGFALAGLGIGGLSYLLYTGGNARAQHTRALISSGNKIDYDISLKRTRDTLIYFTGGLGLTTLITGLMLRNPRLVQSSFNWKTMLITLPGTILCMYQINRIPPTPENKITKSLFFLGFNSLIAFSLLPMIAASELVIIRDAFLLTSGALGGLCLVANNARDDAFLGASGFLGAGLGAIAAVGIANIFLQSNALFNIWLYGGLALFMGLTLYDMKEIQNRAKRSVYFDAMQESLKVYLDFINIFIRLLFILQNRKK